MKKAFALLLLPFLFFEGCAGYHLGPATPSYLRNVHAIAVPTFKNTTLEPRLEVLVTNTAIKQFQQDGTFRIAAADAGDATLKGEIVGVGRSPARSVRGNVLSTTEFNLTLTVKYTLLDRDGKTLTAGAVAGSTSFFVGSDVNTDQRQALPLAAEELARHLVSQLSEGW
ncbi:MAG TPA: LptE family protein [Chthoniobacterales bacterium]|nr:LptE family protein [Chthoniobacterales bacterium]